VPGPTRARLLRPWRLLPTVTDADLLLGYLTPERYAGGQIKLNPQRSEFAIDEEFGDYLDLEPVRWPG
jgi:N-methylhydantoinase A/acetone carboxylase, beta subunit